LPDMSANGAPGADAAGDDGRNSGFSAHSSPDHSDASDASSAVRDDGQDDAGEWPLNPEIQPSGRQTLPAVRPSSGFLKKGKTRTRSLDKETMNWCRVQVAKALKSNTWDLFTGVVVLMDITFTCVDIDYRAMGAEVPGWVEVASSLCLLLYVLELLANLMSRDPSFLKEGWTQLDILIILSGVVQIIFDSVGMSADSFALLRILRVVRILRLLRLFRKFAMLKELRKLLLMATSCFKTLFWSFLFCFVCMVAWSMLAVEMLRLDMEVLKAEGVWQDCSFCQQALSNVMNANLLLFKTVVALDSWGLVAVPLIQYNPIAAVIFCGSQLSIVFGVLNLIVAVVVDQFAEQRTKDVQNMATELEEEADEEFRRLDKMFQLIDGDGDGELTLPELLDGASKSKEFQNRLRVMDIDQADLHQLFGMLDSDGGGTIDPEEFKQTLTRWNFDAKTSNRFIRYAMEQLMKDHANAAQKLCAMEERLSAALYREQAAVAKAERKKFKQLRGLRMARRFRDQRVLPAQKWRPKDEANIREIFGPQCSKPRRPSSLVEGWHRSQPL